MRNKPHEPRTITHLKKAVNIMILTYATADEKIEKLKTQGHDIEWDGWKIISYVPHGGAFLKSSGAFRNGQWTVKTVHEVDENGKWNLPGVYLK